MEKGSCCPKGSWPRLQVDYEAKGEKLEIAGTKCYHVGSGDKILLIVSDIWGVTSGKHEILSDNFAEFGYNVYMPEVLTNPYVGDFDIGKIMENINGQDYGVMRKRFLGTVKQLEEKGHKKFYSIGLCWGLWFTFKMAAEIQNFICIAGPHPSLGVENFFKGNHLQLAKSIKCPAFLYPAGNDPEDVKEGGQVIKILTEKFGEKAGSVTFPDMMHGWTVRGDIADQKVKRDCEKVMDLCKDYFAKFH